MYVFYVCVCVFVCVCVDVCMWMFVSCWHSHKWACIVEQVMSNNVHKMCVCLCAVQALTQMGLQPIMEHVTSDGLFSVDMCIELGQCRFAVEANGPSHYTATSPHRLLGNKV